MLCKRSNFKIVILTIISIYLAGCSYEHGGVGFCRDPCPNPNEKRDMFCGCYVPTSDKDKQPQHFAEIEQIRGSVKDDMNCGICGDARYLKNISNKTLTIKIRRIDSYTTGDEDTYYEPYIKTLKPQNKHYLGCTGGSLVRGGGLPDKSCVVRKRWSTEITSRKSSSIELYDKFNRIAQELSSDSHRLTMVALSGSCENYCSGNGSNAYCKDITESTKNEIGRPINKLLHRFKGKDEVAIEKAVIMNLFQVKEDPCNRENTIISGGKITNSGATSCSIETTVSIGRDIVRLAMEVPTTIVGDIQSQGDSVSIVFKDPAKSPRLNISNKFLHADWGGQIQDVKFKKGLGLIKTENGCLKLQLDSII